MALPGPVTLAFLPHTPYAAQLAHTAFDGGKEIMLHLPMDSAAPRPLGPGGLGLRMEEERFLEILRDDLAAVPHISGVNNHMGSLLTLHAGRMGWLMAELGTHDGLYFVDSRTTPASVALDTARRYGIPGAARDVFLDHDRRPATIRLQLDRLLAKARAAGAAIGIGHPHPETLAVLEERLPALAREGVRLVPLSRLIAINQERKPELWHTSLSPSPQVAKNSKP